MKKIFICIILLISIFCFGGCTYAQNSARRNFEVVEQLDTTTDVPEIIMTITFEKRHESTEIIADANQCEQIDTVVIERGIFRPGYTYESVDSVIIKNFAVQKK